MILNIVPVHYVWLFFIFFLYTDLNRSGCLGALGMFYVCSFTYRPNSPLYADKRKAKLADVWTGGNHWVYLQVGPIIVFTIIICK